MTATELNALAQDLRNECREFQRKANYAQAKANYAQACLNEVQRKLALLKHQAQVDTPLAGTYGG